MLYANFLSMLLMLSFRAAELEFIVTIDKNPSNFSVKRLMNTTLGDDMSSRYLFFNSSISFC